MPYASCVTTPLLDSSDAGHCGDYEFLFGGGATDNQSVISEAPSFCSSTFSSSSEEELLLFKLLDLDPHGKVADEEEVKLPENILDHLFAALAYNFSSSEQQQQQVVNNYLRRSRGGGGGVRLGVVGSGAGTTSATTPIPATAARRQDFAGKCQQEWLLATQNGREKSRI